METIADRIRAWARTEIRNSGVISRHTDALNHMTAAVEKLLAEPWANKPTEVFVPQARSTKPTGDDPLGR